MYFSFLKGPRARAVESNTMEAGSCTDPRIIQCMTEEPRFDVMHYSSWGRSDLRTCEERSGPFVLQEEEEEEAHPNMTCNNNNQSNGKAFACRQDSGTIEILTISTCRVVRQER
jgi:hypothetical protein